MKSIDVARLLRTDGHHYGNHKGTPPHIDVVTLSGTIRLIEKHWTILGSGLMLIQPSSETSLAGLPCSKYDLPSIGNLQEEDGHAL